MTSGLRARRWLWIFLIAFAFTPLFAVDIPAMRDYPNHLAITAVIAQDGGPKANTFYEVQWHLTTNLTMELLVPPLGRLVGVETAAKSFYLASQLLLIGGALMLERVVKGRVQLSPAVATLFLYALPFAWGFLNFEFGLGLALCALALWLALEDRGWPLRAAVHASFVAALFITHLFALGVYGLAAGLHELWRGFSGRVEPRETAGAMVVLAVPAMTLALLATALGGALGGSGLEWRLTHKVLWLFQTTNGYSKVLSFVTMYLLVAIVFLAARRHAVGFARSGAWIAGGFAILYFAIPFDLFGETYNEARVVAAAAFLMPAFLDVRAERLSWWGGLGAAFAALAAANLAAIWWVWLSLRAETAEIIASIDRIAVGSAVLVAHRSDDAEAPSDLTEFPIWHLPALAAATRDAYVATLFTYPGDRPVRMRPVYSGLGVEVDIPPLATLVASASDTVDLPADMNYIRSWTEKYNYLYVFGPRVTNPLPSLLQEVAGGPRFVMYEIKHLRTDARKAL